MSPLSNNVRDSSGSQTQLLRHSSGSDVGLAFVWTFDEIARAIALANAARREELRMFDPQR
jgi:hypothetical protein